MGSTVPELPQGMDRYPIGMHYCSNVVLGSVTSLFDSVADGFSLRSLSAWP